VLINRESNDPQAQLPEKRLVVSENVLMDCEQIALGTYSPLQGFLDREDLESVLHNFALKNGIVWTLPVVLQVERKTAHGLRAGDTVTLTNTAGDPHSLLEITDSYTMNLETMAELWFRTTSRNHPGVQNLLAGDDCFLAGNVTLLRRQASDVREYELTCSQTRFMFLHKGWQRVVGFHTRNVVHRAHEYLHHAALERTFADGLFISPVVGPKKAGDFRAHPILQSYQLMLDWGYYPRDKVILGSFATYSRYSGPREAVFTALCRKNMGCDHFIVGRDHTGVGDFYTGDDNRAIFDQVGDIGITPVFFGAVRYDESTGTYNEGPGSHISGSQARAALGAGERLPAWFMRLEIQDMLHEQMAAGEPLFYGPLG
jgi:ATP sulfurylase